jgi:hypothetical protein
MTTATILSWVLAAAPVPPSDAEAPVAYTPAEPPEKVPRSPIADVEVIESADSTHVFAYDPDGEVAAEVVVWGREGEVRFDALFSDGLYLSMVTDGEGVTVDGDDVQEAAARVGEIHDFLRGSSHRQGRYRVPARW